MAIKSKWLVSIGFSLMFITRLTIAETVFKDEINYLIEQVATSECQFERNGKRYSGLEASTHIKRKYDYYRKSIDSASSFIMKAATKSSLSGKYYLIHCDSDAPKRTSVWLKGKLEELVKRTSP